MKAICKLVLPVVLIAATAAAQDSTAIPPFGAAIGDGVYPWDTGEQINTFVVDLQPITSSLGYEFGLAPLLKSSKMSDQYLSSLLGAQAISNTLRLNVPFARSSYMYWNQPGYGVNNNPGLNHPGTNLNTTGYVGHQFGVAFAETADSDVVEDVSSIIGAVVNYLPANPRRLYVARICAAIDSDGTTPLPQGGNSGSFGFGSVDAHGYVHFRADNAYAQGSNPLDGQYYLRVNLLGRNFNIFNKIDLLGPRDAAATTTFLNGAPSTPVYNTPNIVPAHLAGRPVLIATNFASQYVYESSAGTLSLTTGHLALPVTDHRGAVAFSHRLTGVTGSVGTVAVIGRVGTTAGALNLFDIGSNGQVLNAYSLIAPAALDCGGYAFENAAFGHYFSQTAYQGGNAPVAIGKDLAGRGLVAGVMLQYTANFGYAINPYNAIVVGRFDPANPSAVTWQVAAYVVNTDINNKIAWEGSPLYDRSGNQIGRLCPLFKVTGADPLNPNETRPQGPSMSAPAIDALGNIYFLAACEFAGAPEPRYHNSLVRAVYDAASFSYRLEVIFANRDVFHGQNSNTDYQIAFLSIADSNSIATDTIWSNNVLQSPNPLSRATPGGLVLPAQIIYDVNNDGTFDPTLGVDESYNVVLYLSLPACVRGDANCDGQINAFDIDAFVRALSDRPAWEAAYACDYMCANDCNGDGAVNAFDIDAFVRLLTGG